MRQNLLRGVGVVAVVILSAFAIFWVLRRPSDEIVPTQFRGVWLDPGAECHDIDAQVRITGSTINYDGLSFKADEVTEQHGDTIAITGVAYPGGNAERETVQLRMLNNRSTLFVNARELRRTGPFVRCPAADAD